MTKGAHYRSKSEVDERIIGLPHKKDHGESQQQKWKHGLRSREDAFAFRHRLQLFTEERYHRKDKEKRDQRIEGILLHYIPRYRIDHRQCSETIG